MKFSTQEEVQCPAAEVYERVSNFDSFEKLVRARGAKIARSPVDGVGVGTAWDSVVQLRGKSRQITMTMTEFTPGARMAFAGGSSGLDLSAELDLIPLTPQRTRLRLQIEAKPKTIAARILMQTAKLAKGQMDARFKARFSAYVKAMELP